jgi:hypothetical protein
MPKHDNGAQGLNRTADTVIFRNTRYTERRANPRLPHLMIAAQATLCCRFRCQELRHESKPYGRGD